MTSLEPIHEETALIVESSDIRTITFRVSIPMPSSDKLKSGITMKTRLASNGVDYGPLRIIFSSKKVTVVVIYSRKLFKECKAVTGDLTFAIETPCPASKFPKTPEEHFFYATVPPTVFESPTKYSTMILILKLEHPQPDLSSDLLELYRSQDNADVTFSFEGKELKAHKVILGARSDYFRRMFSAEMKENQTGEIKIIDFMPEVFEEALIFLYSGFTSKCLDRKLAMSLLPLADKYLIERLKKACLDKIKNNLNDENVSEILALATEVNCAALRDACFQLMKTDMTECKRWEILLDIGDRDLSSAFLKTIDGNKGEDAPEK